MNLAVAGRDTTASTLTFSAYMLAEHPHVFHKLQAEVLAIVGPSRRPTFDDFREMKYMKAFINGASYQFCIWLLLTNTICRGSKALCSCVRTLSKPVVSRHMS